MMERDAPAAGPDRLAGQADDAPKGDAAGPLRALRVHQSCGRFVERTLWFAAAQMSLRDPSAGERAKLIPSAHRDGLVEGSAQRLDGLLEATLHDIDGGKPNPRLKSRLLLAFEPGANAHSFLKETPGPPPPGPLESKKPLIRKQSSLPNEGSEGEIVQWYISPYRKTYESKHIEKITCRLHDAPRITY